MKSAELAAHNISPTRHFLLDTPGWGGVLSDSLKIGEGIFDTSKYQTAVK